ncbi:MAG: alpha/beta hydrolase [Janthinobacterium lividum]
MVRLRRGALTVLLGLSACATAWARPDANQPMDDAIVHSRGTGYHFQTLTLDSTDGQRHYQIWIGKPEHPVPASGYPVLYMLDGNAALGALKPDDLRALNQGAAPVLVAVGYAGGKRIDRDGRTLDYTPGPRGSDPLTQLPSGGAEAFLDLLEQRIKPAVAQRLVVDNHQQTLWGHSYGGLLVLDALLTRPHSFQHYASASPSLWWWGPARMNAALAGLAPRLQGQSTSLLLMRGEDEPGQPHAQPMPGVQADQPMLDLLRALQPMPGLQVQYRSFPGLNHGPMLEASLRYLLRH